MAGKKASHGIGGGPVQYRYLVYGPDAQENGPVYRVDCPEWLMEVCDEGKCIVVDLQEQKAYYGGRWAPVVVEVTQQ